MSDLITCPRHTINGWLQETEPWKIVAYTAGTVIVGAWSYDYLFRRDKTIAERGQRLIFRLVRLIPSIRKKIDKELKEIEKSFEDSVIERNKNTPYILELPQNGKTREEIITLVREYLNTGEYNWRSGFVSGTVYRLDEQLIELLTEVYGLASYTNPLHPDIFPGVCKMEAEVVRQACRLFNGDSNSCGTMTSGGTESILMACKAYRDWAREVKGITRPEMVLPTTAHSAFDKSGLYLGIRLRHVKVDPNTFQANIKEMKKAINKNTCMLVGSVPNYPYGTMDDIEEISSLGVKYNIPVHVDCCLGGFLIAFMKLAGHEIATFDFTLPGVTSISADTHKYGYAPKGSSIILYSDKKYRHHQYTVTTDWPGGVYGSPTVNGSRAGGIIAACWATMQYFGLNGYVSATKKIVETTKKIEKGLREIKEIFIFGNPVTSVVAFGSKEFHIYRLSEALSKKGWSLNPLQYPHGIHICVTYMHTREGCAEQFLNDVRTEVKELMKEPNNPVDGKMALYGMSQKIPDRSIVGEFTRFFLDSAYYTPNK